MQGPKISIITVSYNAQATIERCLTSVLQQSFGNVQYIVIDGGSTDDTINIINKYKNNVDIFISEPDKGVYDAMNKGIALASGDIIGMLNADDFFGGDDILLDIAAAFADQPSMAYTEIWIISINKTTLSASGGLENITSGKFNWGWMPPHPTFYCRKEVFTKLGVYRMDYGSAADYELMLRFIHLNGISVHYLNKVMVKMVIGGISNSSIRNRLQAMRYDLKAMRKNNIFLPAITLLCKPIRKIIQYF